MAVVGAQYPSEKLHDDSAIAHLSEFMKADSVAQPSFWEVASVTDNMGAYNIAIVAYWPSRASYTHWSTTSGFQTWWEGIDPEKQQHGWFLEVFFPSLDRFETVFSSNEVPEGAAHMTESLSGAIKKHAYFGSMRDRLPASQTEALVGEESNIPTSPPGGGPGPRTRRRVRVPGKQNLAIIRSGQDWPNTYPEERRLYIETMHPVLIKGMDFIRDHGDQIGCYSCRFMEIIDPLTLKADKDRTFSLAYFDDLASLEGWSKRHPTHLAIFGGFLEYTKKLNHDISLRLWHEVLVLKPEQQVFEYIGCHGNSGMLVSLKEEHASRGALWRAGSVLGKVSRPGVLKFLSPFITVGAIWALRRLVG